jgi:hypothetical protein
MAGTPSSNSVTSTPSAPAIRQDVHETWVAFAAFDPSDIVSIEVSAKSQFLLRELAIATKLAQPLAKADASVRSEQRAASAMDCIRHRA